MNVKVIASTHLGYVAKLEESLELGGKAAGMCYMPGDFETILSEPPEKTTKRINQTLDSGHHSVYDHPMYTFEFDGLPKFLAMVLNNERVYDTSEKSARYTQMKPSPEELRLYNKWLDIFTDLIYKEYSDKYLAFWQDSKKVLTSVRKIAQENARYMISVFTPTTMIYTVSLRQLNYIVYLFKDFIKTSEKNDFNKKVYSAMLEFIEQIEATKLLHPLLTPVGKDRKIAIFDERKSRKEIFSECYSITYKGTFAQYAQAERHRTINYKIRLLDEFEYYIPELLKGNEELIKEWGEDMKIVSSNYPQGMLISIRERATYEDFMLKCTERLCGCAQLEIALQTKETLNKYLEATKEDDKEIYELLLKYSKGARCTFPNYTCNNRCIWGAKEAFTRKI